MKPYDATRDVTEKDLARQQYEKLRSEQIEWKAKRERETVKVKPFNILYKFILGL